MTCVDGGIECNCVTKLDGAIDGAIVGLFVGTRLGTTNLNKTKRKHN